MTRALGLSLGGPLEPPLYSRTLLSGGGGVKPPRPPTRAFTIQDHAEKIYRATIPLRTCINVLRNTMAPQLNASWPFTSRSPPCCDLRIDRQPTARGTIPRLGLRA